MSAELERELQAARDEVVALARQLVEADRSSRSYATVVLREAVARLDKAESQARQAALSGGA